MQRGSPSADQSPSLKGVKLFTVCGKVPVLELESSSIFHENVSWMLQSALGSSSKADSLYEYCDDADIMAACRLQGLRKDDVGIVRVRLAEFNHIKAVGTTGKRSIMLAVTVALALHDEEGMDDLWTDLREYKLNRPFWDLLVHGNPRYGVSYWNDYKSTGATSASSWSGGADWGSSAKDQSPPPQPVSGVEILVVREGKVPVLTLERMSVLHENVSWLLQTALSSGLKADALFEYTSDSSEAIVRNAARLGSAGMGVSAQDVRDGLAKVKQKGLEYVKAVGLSGKRSIMLSLFVALVLNGEVELDLLRREVSEYNDKLIRPIFDLLRYAEHLTMASGGGSSGGGSSGGGSRTKKWDDGYEDEAVRDSKKRKSEDWGSYSWDDSGWGKQTSSSRTRSKKNQPKETADPDVLDLQLKEYFADGRR